MSINLRACAAVTRIIPDTRPAGSLRLFKTAPGDFVERTRSTGNTSQHKQKNRHEGGCFV